MKKVFVHNLNKNCEPATDLFSKAIRFLELNDYEIVNSIVDADTALVNTCAVFKTEEDKSIRVVENYINRPNIEKTIFFGCAANTVDDFKDDDRVEHVGPKDLEKMNDIFQHKVPMNGGGVNQFVESEYIERTSKKLIKNDFYIHISQGCTHACTFCNIKAAKGGVTSKPIESIVTDIVNYIQKVRKDSYEFVLQSDDCGGYGHDFGVDFVELMEALSEINKDIKYKVSNIHPQDLIRLWPRLKKYITKFSYMNIPLESGSSRIMDLMYRFYSINDVAKILKEIKKISPETWLFSDFVINFPTETMDDLKLTLQYGKLYDEKRYINYSEFPGAKSAKIFPKVTDEERIERADYISEWMRENGDNAQLCGMEWYYDKDNFINKAMNEAIKTLFK